MKQAAHEHPKKSAQHLQEIQAKNVYLGDFLREKLDHIHNNPIAKQWQLASSRADYQYSSACFYDRGEMPIIPVDDIRP